MAPNRHITPHSVTDETTATTAPVSTTTPTGTEAGLYVRVVSTPGGGGGGAVTIADGANVVEGATTDVAVTGDNPGTISAKLRGLLKILTNVWDSVNGRLRVDGSGVVQQVANAPGDSLISVLADTDGQLVGVTDNALDVHIKQEDAVPIADSTGQPIIAVGGALSITGTVQSAAPIATSGTLINANDALTVSTNNAAVLVVTQTVGSTSNGQIQFEVSNDGVNWESLEGMSAKGTTGSGQVISFTYSAGAGSFQDAFIFSVSAFTNFRVRVSQALGSAITYLITESSATTAPQLIWGKVNILGTPQIQILDGGNGGAGVTVASTAATASQRSLVVGFSPNSPLPTGTNAIGSVTATGAALETGGNLATIASLASFQQQNLDVLRRIDASLRALLILQAQSSTSTFDVDDILNSDPLTIN